MSLAELDFNTTVRDAVRATFIIFAAGLLSGGCIVPPPPPPPPNTTVELVNETSLTVDANFYISADASDDGGLFVSGNLYTAYSDRPIPTLGPRQTVSFPLACDLIRSMGVSRSIFVNPLTFTGGESGDRIIALRDSDFTCGDTLRFVYFSEDDAYRVRLERP